MLLNDGMKTTIRLNRLKTTRTPTIWIIHDDDRVQCRDAIETTAMHRKERDRMKKVHRCR
jgi:Icc-related predicted phosphoesterase